MKIYAIVYPDGRTESVESWDECKTKTSGVSGVKYKSFEEPRLMKAWIASQLELHSVTIDQVQHDPTKLCFYTDGAYKKSGRGYAGWAYVYMSQSDVLHMDSGRTPDKATSRNIDGEVYAAYKALDHILRLQPKRTYYIVHDLLHISQWAKGLWKLNPNQLYGALLCDTYNKVINAGFDIVFIHVKGHTGKVIGNNLADQLATKYSD